LGIPVGVELDGAFTPRLDDLGCGAANVRSHLAGQRVHDLAVPPQRSEAHVLDVTRAALRRQACLDHALAVIRQAGEKVSELSIRSFLSF
jgi:hypothetical protein